MMDKAPVAALAVDPRRLYVPTGILVQAGERYAFSARGQWRDWFKDVGAEGWGGGLLTRCNRLPGRPFFLLCGTLGRDDRLAFGIGAQLPEWRVPEAAAGLADRQLYLFANDLQWMYWNNRALGERHGGPLRLDIYRLA